MLADVAKALFRIPIELVRPTKAPEDQIKAALQVVIPRSMIPSVPAMDEVIVVDDLGWGVYHIDKEGGCPIPLHEGSKSIYEVAEFVSRLPSFEGILLRNPEGIYTSLE